MPNEAVEVSRAELLRENRYLRSEIDKLARYIMEWSGSYEPSHPDEGAVDCIIRMTRERCVKLDRWWVEDTKGNRAELDVTTHPNGNVRFRILEPPRDRYGDGSADLALRVKAEIILDHAWVADLVAMLALANDWRG